MQKKMKLVIAAASVASIFACGPAFAVFGVGDVVIDPSNLVKNTATSLSAVKTEINTAATYIKQIEANISLARSLTSLQGIASLAGVQEELALYQKLRATSTQLAGVIDQSRQLSQGVEAGYGASKLSWPDYLKTRSSISQQAAQGLAAQYQSIDKNMELLANRRKEILQRVQDAAGQTEATQTVTIAIDTLIGQNQQMAAALSAKAKADQSDASGRVTDEALGLSILTKRQMELRASDSKFK